MIITPLLHYFSDKAESLYKRTPLPTLETSEKQELACITFKCKTNISKHNFFANYKSETHYKANNSNIELFVHVTIIYAYHLQKCIENNLQKNLEIKEIGEKIVPRQKIK